MSVEGRRVSALALAEAGVAFRSASAVIRVAGPRGRDDLRAQVSREIAWRENLMRQIAGQRVPLPRIVLASPVPTARVGACACCGDPMAAYRGGDCALCTLALQRLIARRDPT